MSPSARTRSGGSTPGPAGDPCSVWRGAAAVCRYASTAPAPPLSLARRSVTPGPGLATGYTSPQVQVVTSSSVPTSVLQVTSSSSYSATRRNSVSVTSSASLASSSTRQRHYSASVGTPAASRGLPFY